MQAIVRHEVDKALDIKKLRTIVPPYCSVRKYDTLKGKTLKDVMGRYSVLIILWNLHDKKHRTLNEPGHFFVLITRGPEDVVCFSSTGMSPKKELFVTQSDPTVFDRILPANVTINHKRLQLNGSSNTCWRWCLLFAHFAPMGLKKFQQLFWRPNLHLTNSDDVATVLTLMSLY